MVDLPLLDQLAKQQREAVPDGCLECGCDASKYISFPDFDANGVFISIVCENCDAERLEYYVFRSAIAWRSSHMRIHVEQKQKEAIHEMARVGTDETLESIVGFWVGQPANSGGDLFTKELVERVLFDDNIGDIDSKFYDD